MKSLNEFKQELENEEFDLEHESNMVQSRILSPIIEAIEVQNITQVELSKKTGLKQPFISGLLNIRKKLNMEHIARFQKALDIIIQPPSALTNYEHKNKFYNKEDYSYCQRSIILKTNIKRAKYYDFLENAFENNVNQEKSEWKKYAIALFNDMKTYNENKLEKVY